MTQVDRAYDRAIEMAAASFLASQTVDDGVRHWMEEAIGLRGGAVGSCYIAVEARQVVIDVFNRINMILTTELMPKIRQELPDIADAFEAAMCKATRDAVAATESKWPTRQ